MIWKSEIDDYSVEIHEIDGYHGGTYAELRILNSDGNIYFSKPVYVNYGIYHSQITKEDVELWKTAAKDILSGDETGIWRCCSSGCSPWNPNGTLKCKL